MDLGVKLRIHAFFAHYRVVRVKSQALGGADYFLIDMLERWELLRHDVVLTSFHLSVY